MPNPGFRHERWIYNKSAPATIGINNSGAAIKPKSYGPMTKGGMSGAGAGVEFTGDWNEFKQWLNLGEYKSAGIDVNIATGSGSNFSQGLIGYKTYDVNSHEIAIKAALQSAAAKAVKLIVSKIKEGIKTGTPGGKRLEPLSSGTIQLRLRKSKKRGEKAKSWVGAKGTGYFSGKKPLMRTGDLYRAITGYVVGNGGFFAGIPKGTKNREGEDLSIIGYVAEKGMLIKTNDAIGSWFAAQGVPLKKNTSHIIVPARPFIQPVLQAYKNDIKKIYVNEINTFLYSIKGFTPKQQKYFISKRNKIK